MLSDSVCSLIRVCLALLSNPSHLTPVKVLATGGSAIKAIEVLLQHGVAEDKIIFVNLLCVPGTSPFFAPSSSNLNVATEGLSNVLQKFPKIRIVTAEIDAKLDKDHFISPGIASAIGSHHKVSRASTGLGDFGCIYFGTGK